ncbi:MAG: hypothetical protein ACPLXM_06040 [Bacteroidales bacterium]
MKRKLQLLLSYLMTSFPFASKLLCKFGGRIIRSEITQKIPAWYPGRRFSAFEIMPPRMEKYGMLIIAGPLHIEQHPWK